MMDKIAIISDIHGNLEALKAVLKDIKERNINKIFCLGDIIAKGNHQQECVNLIKDNCEIVVRGNCDEYFTSEVDLTTKSEQEVKRILWNKEMINQEATQYLKNLPFCYEFYISGRLVRIFHSNPLDTKQFIGNIDSFENYYKLFLPSDKTISQEKADLVVYGHIHVPYMQKLYNRIIINAGSVGNSIDTYRNDDRDGDIRNTRVTSYCILSGILNSKDYNNNLSYEIVNLNYDFEKELLDNKNNIEPESYEKEIRYGKYRDMNKVNNIKKDMGIDINKI